MNKLLPLSMLLFLVPGCAGRAGDGDVFACSCDVAYINSNGASYYQGSMDVSLCEVDFTTDHVADAQQKCTDLLTATDTSDDMHECACSCVHTTDACYTKPTKS
jgi:hypothetical protein